MLFLPENIFSEVRVTNPDILFKIKVMTKLEKRAEGERDGPNNVCTYE
jgi:hypothetical protein